MPGSTGELVNEIWRSRSVSDVLDLLSKGVETLGYSSIIYDYSPVPLSHDGKFIIPNLLYTRNVPKDFSSVWCDQGFYDIDPLQQICLVEKNPFSWSLLNRECEILNHPITREHKPVTEYLNDTHLSCGVTVPLHYSDGSLATVSFFHSESIKDFTAKSDCILEDVSLWAWVANEAILRVCDQSVKERSAIRLTDRELECLNWIAMGKTDEVIACILDRSISTVRFHIRNVQQKLGAQNRPQMISHAAHYRLIDTQRCLGLPTI